MSGLHNQFPRLHLIIFPAWDLNIAPSQMNASTLLQLIQRMLYLVKQTRGITNNVQFKNCSKNSFE